MNTWQYAYLKFHTDESGRQAKLFFAGQPAVHYQGDEADLLKILDRLGADGWEAVSHTYDPPGSVSGDALQWMSILLKRAA
jgi:hypothetical protein